MPTNRKTVEYFATRKENKREGGAVVWHGTERSTLYCTKDVLYSYGPHFPLAVFLGEIEKNGISVE